MTKGVLGRVTKAGKLPKHSQVGSKESDKNLMHPLPICVKIRNMDMRLGRGSLASLVSYRNHFDRSYKSLRM